MGYNLTDYNTNQTIGFSQIQARLRRGRRQSASKAFLDTARNRNNLVILDDAKVTKILIDAQTKTAIGVEFIKRNGFFSAKARREVIVSAGAYNSPKLLMLSGIGK